MSHQLLTWLSLQLDVTLFGLAIAVTHDNWIAMRNLGGALVAAGRAQEGIAQFRSSHALAPRQPGTDYQLGSALAAGGDWAGALPFFTAAVDLMPDYGSAQYARGTALARLGRTEEAVPSLERALTLKLDRPFQAEAHNTLGVRAAGSWNRAGAERHFRAAVELNPSLDIARRNLEALMRGGSR